MKTYATLPTQFACFSVFFLLRLLGTPMPRLLGAEESSKNALTRVALDSEWGADREAPPSVTEHFEREGLAKSANGNDVFYKVIYYTIGSSSLLWFACLVGVLDYRSSDLASSLLRTFALNAGHSPH